MNWWDALIQAPPAAVYVALFALLVVEGTGMPLVPYEPAFLAAGMLIRAGRMSLPLALAVGALGNLLGNLIGYHLGRAGGRLMARYGPLLGVTPARLAVVEGWFHRYGALTNFVGRFFGVIRTPAILGAGMARIGLPRFLAWSAAGGTLWTLAWLWAAVAAGGPLMALGHRYGAWAGIAALLALPAAAVVLHRWRRAAHAQRRCRSHR